MEHGNILPLTPDSTNDWEADFVHESSSVDDICCRSFSFKLDYSSIPEGYEYNADQQNRQEIFKELNKSFVKLQEELKQWVLSLK